MKTPTFDDLIQRWADPRATVDDNVRECLAEIGGAGFISALLEMLEHGECAPDDLEERARSLVSHTLQTAPVHKEPSKKYVYAGASFTSARAAYLAELKDFYKAMGLTSAGEVLGAMRIARVVRQRIADGDEDVRIVEAIVEELVTVGDWVLSEHHDDRALVEAWEELEAKLAEEVTR